jgi:uncharacterized membrane protein
MNIDAMTLVAILGMALATYATRVGGLYLMRGVTVKGRLKSALDALPPAILVAVIAPTVLTTGVAETVAAVITAGAALLRVPLTVTIVTGVISVMLLRMILN